jgi:hypothetical protein
MTAERFARLWASTDEPAARDWERNYENWARGRWTGLHLELRLQARERARKKSTR